MPRPVLTELHARSPIDRTAARVSAPSEGSDAAYTPPLGSVDSIAPPPFSWRPRSVIDLRGRTFGAFQVIGFYEMGRQLSADREGPRWVVRCSCGIYSIRSERALTNPINVDDRCDRCRTLVSLRKRALGEKTSRAAEPHKRPEISALPPNTPDLTGTRIGTTLRIVGYFGTRAGSRRKGALWVAECDCGDRFAISTQNVKRFAENETSRCRACERD